MTSRARTLHGGGSLRSLWPGGALPRRGRATALLLGLRGAKRSQMLVVSASEARAIVAKRSSSPIVMALHVTRTADALGNPYEMKLARCFRFPFGVQSAIQEAGLGHRGDAVGQPELLQRWQTGRRQGWQATGQGPGLSRRWWWPPGAGNRMTNGPHGSLSRTHGAHSSSRSMTHGPRHGGLLAMVRVELVRLEMVRMAASTVIVPSESE